MRYVHDEISDNYRFTNLQAAVGLAQLEKLDEHIKKKREIGKRYMDCLNGISGIKLPVERTEYAENIYWVFGLVLSESVSIGARDMVKVLHDRGIGARTFFWCIHEQPVYKRSGLFSDECYPIAQMLARYGLYLPCGLGIQTGMVNQVANILKLVLEEKKWLET